MPLWAAFSTYGKDKDYVQSILMHNLLHHFRRQKANLHIVHCPLMAGGNRPHLVKNDIDWIMASSTPPNTLLYVDTHSDVATGQIIYGGSAPRHLAAALAEIIDAFYGKQLQPILRGLHSTSIRGLVLLTCGSAIRVPTGHQALTELVESGTFDFVLAFAGHSTIDHLVGPGILKFVESVYVFKESPWEAVISSFAGDVRALESTPVALIFRPKVEAGATPVTETRILARSTFLRPWGIDLYRCRNVACRQPILHLKFNVQKKSKDWTQLMYRSKCCKCHQETRNYARPTWVHPIEGTVIHHTWFNWPLTDVQLAEVHAKREDIVNWLM
ncbi:hypothetical protein BV22DRAFT_1042327 [Leucogyrophana mollusca]|uniref:Uncharacterized protein n=1 Tax=Leucogyrophana mollusca TaxID=85980 RepID=A0ACB8AY43_9AGAM|nr:hypothetical protein BV22DRAFT_1042327 [Leucogyrophana mollusca]